MSSQLPDWATFQAALKASGVSDDTIDVLEAEGYDERMETLLKITTSSLDLLRLDKGQAEKASKVIEKFRPKEQEQEGAREDCAKNKGSISKSKGASDKKQDTMKSDREKLMAPIQKETSEILKNVTTTMSYINDTEKGEAKRKVADAAIKSIYPGMQKLASLVNVLPKGYNSVKRGASELVKSTQALMKFVDQTGGRTPDLPMRRTLDMIFERFEGSVAYIKLATLGKSTDFSSTKLLSAAGKGIEDRLFDAMNACKLFDRNTAGLPKEEKQVWAETMQGLWVSVKGVLETMKYLVPLLLQKSSREQMLSTLDGAEKTLVTLAPLAKKLDLKAYTASEIETKSQKLIRELAGLKRAVDMTEPEIAPGPPSASSLRRAGRRAISRALFLLSATENVAVELPDLKGLGSAVNDLVKPLNEFQEIVAKAVVKPAGTAEHTAILRKAKEVGELVDKLADFTEKSLPQIKRIGKTENLERRVKDARGYFDKVKPAASN